MRFTLKFLKVFLSSWVLFTNTMISQAIAPRSQADGKFIYEFDVRRFTNDGYILYTEPGRNQVLAFFLGEIVAGDFHYYVIDVFDLSTGKRIGFLDFNTYADKSAQKATTSFATALEWVKSRTYKDAALKAAAEYGFKLGNTDQGVQEMMDFRKTAPVDPPPAIYLEEAFQRKGRHGWKHISDILICFMIDISIQKKSAYIGISPEDGLAYRNFYERRYGALRRRGWYLDLFPSAYARLGKVALNGMVFDFDEGIFRPHDNTETTPDAIDVFIESIPVFDQKQLAEINERIQTNLFPDLHVWSFLKVLSEFMGEDTHSRLREWVSEFFQTRGKKPLIIPISLENIPESLRKAAAIVQEKGLILFNGTVQEFPPLGAEVLGGRSRLFVIDSAA